MPIETCRNIIMLYRLRDRARRLIDVHRRAGNLAIAGIYANIDKWLETQMAHLLSPGH